MWKEVLPTPSPVNPPARPSLRVPLLGVGLRNMLFAFRKSRQTTKQISVGYPLIRVSINNKRNHAVKERTKVKTNDNININMSLFRATRVVLSPVRPHVPSIKFRGASSSPSPGSHSHAHQQPTTALKQSPTTQQARTNNNSKTHKLVPSLSPNKPLSPPSQVVNLRADQLPPRFRRLPPSPLEIAAIEVTTQYLLPSSCL
jgi:hypothetical protein